MNQLRALREAAGVSQIALARDTGISRFWLYEAEFGMGQLTEEEPVTIKRVLSAKLLPKASKHLVRNAVRAHAFFSELLHFGARMRAVEPIHSAACAA